MATDPRASAKARITSSLFNTRGEDGNPVEQYITHVRITEDSAHPSTPPANGADTSNRKQRCIVVSVQRNGIVRMHKTRENSNGTFSIGKTWSVDQVGKLEETDTLGFVITIQKPYYWLTETSKDKYAFVTALIQVYRKFTGGKTPEIVGFESIFRQSGSQNARRQTPPATTRATPPPQPSTNPYAAPLPPTSNPYATSPPQLQTNPYAAASTNPYASSGQTDRYAVPAVPPLKTQKQPFEVQDRRPPPPEERRSRESNRNSPERPRSRDKQTRDPTGFAIPPLPQVAPLNISRQTSSSSILRPTPSDASLASGYESQMMQRSQRQEDDTTSLNSLGSRTGRTVGPRPMVSAPALRSSPIPSQRALTESSMPRPDSAARSTPPSPPQTKATPTSRHGPKLSISTSTSLPTKLQNGLVTPTVETPQRTMSTQRKRPRSVDDSVPSEETLSAAMLEIESLVTSFDWSHPTPCATRLEKILTDEFEAVESENVHALVMNDGAQMHDFISRVEDGIRQCEELDEMLTLYLVELQALADDVNFIESENRGLHVRTANERSLEKELSELLSAMSISPREYEVLKQESLEKLEAIERVEQSLLQVYRALKASQGLEEQQNKNGITENMQIVKEMRRATRAESDKFLARLREFVKIKFQAELMAIPSAKKSKSKPSFPDHTTSYSYFYRYAGFILFAKEVNQELYKDIQELYLSPASKSYKEDFQSYVSQWKSFGRKATADDLEFIFSMVKEPQSTVSAVRSATIKRTGTVAKTLRAPLIDGIGRSEKDRERTEQDGRLQVSKIFDEILSATVQAIVQEQSFVMEFLHLSPAASSGKSSYEDFITTGNKAAWQKSIATKRPAELNKTAARDTMHAMEQLLFWLPEELSSIIEWCRTSDALQLVGVLGALEKQVLDWEDTDQSFIVRTLNKQHDKLGGLFHRFLEEQVRAIEDMKVTAKKRQGVLLMFKIFPGFIERIETQFETNNLNAGLDVRDTVNEAYEKIAKAMFDSLQAIAKDNTSHQQSGTKDDDDKEQLNSHISMIENMHYYRETVNGSGNQSLAKYKSKAQSLFQEHLGLYLKAVIRRPLGRLLDFLQGVETFVQSNPSEDVTARISFSKSAFRKVLSHYDPKELRKGIDLLHRRVDKHFGQVQDDSDGLYGSRGPAIAKELVQEVWGECQKEYVEVVELCKRIVTTHYADGVQIEFSRNDVNEAFARWN